MRSRIHLPLFACIASFWLAPAAADPPDLRPVFPLVAVDPCETQVLPFKGREEACLRESQSCVNAFGIEFECRYLTGNHCNCVYK